MRTDVWGQHLLALGPSRDIPSSFARDGNLTPFSMTFAFLASCEDHASLVLKWSSCSLLWSSYYSWVSCGREIALLLIFVDLVSRVGGMGANFFSGMHWIKLGLEALKLHGNLSLCICAQTSGVNICWL